MSEIQEKSGHINGDEIEGDTQENKLKEPKLVLKSLLSKKPSLVHDVVGLDGSDQSTFSPQNFFTPNAAMSESKQYQRKVFMQVEDSRTPGQWIDYGKRNGITDDKLLPNILKGMSDLTVDRYDRDVQNIVSRIEGGTPIAQDQLPPRLNACTVYPEPESSFDITQEAIQPQDVPEKQKEIQKQETDINYQLIVNTPIKKSVPTFLSSFGTRCAAAPCTNNSVGFTAKNIPVKSVMQSFFEEQSSTPKNFFGKAEGDSSKDKLLKEAPQNLSVCFTPMLEKSACFNSNGNSPALQFSTYHVNTPGDNLQSGNQEVKNKVVGSAVSSLATASAMVEKENANTLFFGLVMAEFNSFSIAKQKALKKAIMNVIYED